MFLLVPADKVQNVRHNCFIQNHICLSYKTLSLTKFQASLNITVVSSYLLLIMINLIGVFAFIDSFTVVIYIALILSGRLI